MVKISTFFFCYSNFDSTNNLLTYEDLNEPEGLYTKELEKIFGRIRYSPPKRVIRKILEKI